MVDGARKAAACIGHGHPFSRRSDEIIWIQRHIPEPVDVIQREERQFGEREGVGAVVFQVRHSHRARSAVALLIDFVGAEAQRVVDADLAAFAAAVRQRDRQRTRIVQPPTRVGHPEVADCKARRAAVFRREDDALAGHTVQIDDLRQIERRRPDEDRQQDRQVRQKAAEAAIEPLVPDPSPAAFRHPAAGALQMLFQSCHALQRQQNGAFHPRAAVDQRLRPPKDRQGAQQRAERQIQA